MAITVATHGPMLEALRAQAEALAVTVSSRYPHDADVAALHGKLNGMQTLIAELTADDDTGFVAVATEFGVEE